jgi:diguanylate cyclase (GGDEF)-like protein/PAS domain S-box-containing protein
MVFDRTLGIDFRVAASKEDTATSVVPGDIAFIAEVMQQLVVPSFVLDTTGRVIVWNNACERLTAMPAAEVLGTRNHWRAFYDVQRPCLCDLMVANQLSKVHDHYPVCEPSANLAHGVHTEIWTVLPLRGKRVYLEIDAGPVRDAQGRLICVVETLRDMSLRESAQQRSRTLFEMSPEPTWILEDGKMVDCNAAAMDLYRYKNKEQFFNLHVSKRSPLMQPDGESSFSKGERMMRLARENGQHRFEWMFSRADGTNFIADVVLATIDIDGRPAIYTVARDITQSKQAEDTIRLYAKVFEHSNEAILIANSDNRIMSANHTFTKLTGYTLDEVRGKYPHLLAVDKAGTETYETMWQDVHDSGYWQGELTDQRKDGSEFQSRMSISTVRDEKGGLSNYIVTFADVTERHRAEERIASLLERQRLILDNVHVGIIFVRHRMIVSANQRQAEIYGFANAKDLEGQDTRVLCADEEQYEEIGSRLYDDLAEKGYAQKEYEMRRQDGKMIWIMLTGRPINPEAVSEGAIWVCTDVTEAHQQKAQLELSERVFAHSSEALMITDALGIIVSVNDAFCAITGFPREEAIGSTPRILKSGRHDDEFYKEMWQATLAKGRWDGEVWDRRKNGEIYPKWLSITVVRDAQGQVINFIGSFSDISARKAAEQEIQYLAHHDALTGLCNRYSLESRLAQSLVEAKRANRSLTVMFIDLDRFKVINDTLGHHIGDMLLIATAQRLSSCVRESDIVARLGGDEFIVVSTGHVGADHAIPVALKILESLGAPHFIDGKLLHSTPSIGIAAFPENGEDTDSLMKHADAAMYYAKESGRNNFQFYSSAMMEAATERLELERDMRNALPEDQFLLYYQPQVESTGQIVGAEVLLRWRHPHRGMVSPADFIPLAEETDLILPLGDWVMRTACQQLALWALRPELAELTVAVNVSARQFLRDDFADRVLTILRETGANPQRLKLELTESLLAKDIERIITTMHRLKAHGIGFSLDDFGTGYSSLSYLKRLPLDQLKIDQSFVCDLLIDANDAAIVRTVIALGQTMGLAVIAEGVETEEQRELLAASGCFTYQGYLFSRPTPVEEFEKQFRVP